MVGIYKIINPKGKVYIGSTVNISKRKRKYINGHIKTQPLINESIKYYGWDNHTFEIIEECLQTNLREREKYWINLYGSCGEGLNKNKGGGGPLYHSEETKNKMRGPKSLEHCLNISKSTKGIKKPSLSKFMKGKPSRFKGKKHSNATRNKMSEAKLGKSYSEIFGEENGKKLKHLRSLPRNGTKIKCLNDGNVFKSIKEAADYYNILPNSIGNVLKGVSKSLDCNLKFLYVSS